MDLNYKTFGQGEPVIILHGMFGTLDNWQTLARRLADHHTVYIVDQRNHGRSPHTDTMSYPEMAEDLRHFMEDHWIYNAHIVGHSMGGKTAMAFALHYPEMVDKLVVVDIAPRAYPGGHQEIFEVLLALDLSAIRERSEADDFLKPRVPEPSIRQFLLKNLTRDKDGGYRWKMNLPVIYQHYSDILAEIKNETPYAGPALFIRGENSSYVQPGDDENVRSLFPNARIETIPDAGHWVHSERPDAFFEHLQAFLG